MGAHNKTTARDAIEVSIVSSGRRCHGFAGRQQLVEGAPVSSMPFCGPGGRCVFAPPLGQISLNGFYLSHTHTRTSST